MRVPAISPSILEGRSGAGLALGLLLLALLVTWLGVVSPLIGWYRARGEALAEQRSLAQHMEALAATLPALRAEAEHARGTIPEATLIFGDTDAVAAAALQGRIEEMARQEDARLASVAILPGEPAGSWRRIGLRIEVDAPFAVVVRLLQSLLNTTPVMTIDEVSLTAAAISVPGRPGTMDAEFTVYAFRRGTLPGRTSRVRQASAQ